ncbi:PACE efflux transporter [Oceanisphaera sp. IT1-181]|uniref:PACE efflux transporter n=1 Tax=Oceanisphaera sp. IT1-181 TaxID=3081199 RepID=UPI0029CA8FC4|nr:PACE efflux transporter [Oceanisphaera sp. IT1-181]
MRTTKDRIRHTLGFEGIGLILFIPMASWLFGFDLQLMGTMAVVGSILATVWNYFYNLLFDHSMLKLRGDVRKTVPLRLFHALFFELGLLSQFVPVLAWYLGISLREALMMSVTMATFYLVYAFVYNLAYDKVFPVPYQSPQVQS